MFEGTQNWFKICYFLTAMIPAYALFILELDIKDRLISYGCVLLSVAIGLIIGLTLKSILFKRSKTAVVTPNYTVKLVSKNGEILSFIFGIIIPSVLLPGQAGNVEKTVIFFVIQLLCYLVIVRSSTILPNVILLVLGIDVYFVEENEFILTIHQKIKTSEKVIQVYRLGDSSENNIFIKDN